MKSTDLLGRSFDRFKLYVSLMSDPGLHNLVHNTAQNIGSFDQNENI